MRFRAPLVMLMACAAAGTGCASGDCVPAGPPVDAEAIHAAGRYLVTRCSADGQFRYRENTSPEVRLKPKYNLIRHAGAIYALAMYEETYPRQDTQEAIRRAVRYLRHTSLRLVPEAGDALAVWSSPEVTHSRAPLQAKLGGSGLGLAALLAAETAVPGTATLEECRRIGRFILFMQKADGSFCSKYIPGAGGRDDSWVSLYYPGEAALGLIMLYEHDPDKAWLRGATRAMKYLADVRRDESVVEADHWALIATGKLLSHLPETEQSPLRRDILVHAGQICSDILKQKADIPRGVPEFGCFMDDGRTCPTATRLEGLIAAMAYLPAKSRPALARSLDAGIAFLVRTQVAEVPYAGGMPRAVRPLPREHPRYSPSFNRRATELRIDYVQHALCAMLTYNRLLNRNAGAPAAATGISARSRERIGP